MLSLVNLQNPLLWAILIGWILTVVLHEFAHGLVGYLGGDYTIKERGGLSLNPLQYVDPVMSLLLPAIFLMMGGVPLPGGATFIRRDLIRSPLWNSLVSAAGPAMNLLLFALLCIPLHPRMGWINYAVLPSQWTTAQIFVAAMAVLQLEAALLNLTPIPPLDGFGIIAPYLPVDLRQRLTGPPWNYALYFIFFMILTSQPASAALWETVGRAFDQLGLSGYHARYALSIALFGE
jgi:Zn-dependent protease